MGEKNKHGRLLKTLGLKKANILHVVKPCLFFSGGDPKIAGR